MFGWLKRRAQIAIVNAETTDIERFILGLKGGSDHEVGAIVAMANHWRLMLESQYDWDLDHPDMVILQDIGAGMKVSSLLRRVQRENPFMASGLMVWLHTIRASQTPEIRLKGREMWTELARGIPFAEEAAYGFYELANVRLLTPGIDRVPSNLGTF